MITQTHPYAYKRARRPLSRLAPLLFTTLICLPFLTSGIDKLIDHEGATREVAALGLGAPSFIAWLTIVVQLTGSLAAVLGSRLEAVLGCLALAGFTVLATLLAHAFWNAEPAVRPAQMNAFIEHLSIVAALLLVAWLKWRDEALRD